MRHARTYAITCMYSANLPRNLVRVAGSSRIIIRVISSTVSAGRGMPRRLEGGEKKKKQLEDSAEIQRGTSFHFTIHFPKHIPDLIHLLKRELEQRSLGVNSSADLTTEFQKWTMSDSKIWNLKLLRCVFLHYQQVRRLWVQWRESPTVTNPQKIIAQLSSTEYFVLFSSLFGFWFTCFNIGHTVISSVSC